MPSLRISSQTGLAGIKAHSNSLLAIKPNISFQELSTTNDLVFLASSSQETYSNLTSPNLNLDTAASKIIETCNTLLHIANELCQDVKKTSADQDLESKTKECNATGDTTEKVTLKSSDLQCSKVSTTKMDVCNGDNHPTNIRRSNRVSPPSAKSKTSSVKVKSPSAKKKPRHIEATTPSLKLRCRDWNTLQNRNRIAKAKGTASKAKLIPSMKDCYHRKLRTYVEDNRHLWEAAGLYHPDYYTPGEWANLLNSQSIDSDRLSKESKSNLEVSPNDYTPGQWADLLNEYDIVSMDNETTYEYEEEQDDDDQVIEQKPIFPWGPMMTCEEWEKKEQWNRINNQEWIDPRAHDCWSGCVHLM
jgi:hypothetical protein